MASQRFGPAVRVGDDEIDITVDIDVQRVEEDSRVARGSNEAEMDEVARRVMEEQRKLRPKATIKGYRKGLACWAAFCARRNFTDKDLVHEKKILLFLKEDVLTMRTTKRPAKKMEKLSTFDGGRECLVFSPPATLPSTPVKQPLTPETVESSYVSPLIDLWTEQGSLRSNPYPHPRGALLSGLMKSLKKQKVQQARESFEDEAMGTLDDGYNAEEYSRLCSVTLATKNQLGSWLRTRVDIQFLHAGALRSESSRDAELSKLSVHLLGGEEFVGSWTPCLILKITDGKTLESGHKDYTGILRHKDPVACPLTSLAFYLFWRFDIDGESLPDFNSRQSWYRRRLIAGKQEGWNSLSYETQALWIRRAFAEAGIHSSKVTHTMRGSSARIAEAQGISEDQIRRAGHWERGSMSTAYLSQLPREWIRTTAGFSATPGNYHLRRAAVEPPTGLKSQIWPWVDHWLARYRASIVSNRSFVNGGLDDCDQAGRQFLELLAWLRVILLQDAAVLQRQFPQFPLWQQPIFCSPDWRRFADEVLVAHDTAEEPRDVRIRQVLPDIEESVRTSREAVLSRVDLHSSRVNAAMEEGFARVNDSLNALRASIPEPIVAVPRSLVHPDALRAYLATDCHTAAPPSSQYYGQPFLPSVTTTDITATVMAVTPTAVPSSGGASLLSSFSSSAAAAVPSIAQTSLIPLTDGGWPVEPFDPNVATVEDAWREWHVGLGAGAAKRDSILALEAKFGSAWRHNQRIRQWHSRRKKVIHLVEQRVQKGHRLQGVFAQLKATRKSLDRLRKDVEKGIDPFL
jgi:Centromere DNA-binding protein complex CBF3 subunit, domain 2/Transcriptional activator of glycolytic enzymes